MFPQTTENNFIVVYFMTRCWRRRFIKVPSSYSEAKEKLKNFKIDRTRKLLMESISEEFNAN